MAIFRNQEGEWKTSETGVHYFIPNGMSPEEAWKSWTNNNRIFQTYWIENEPDKYGTISSYGVSKKEYEKELAKGKKGHTKPFGESWTEHIPEDIEYRMDQALSKITSITNKKDFLHQLEKNVEGMNFYNKKPIIDAFYDEIAEKYNKLIEPNVKKVESINIDNATEVFNKSLNFRGNINSEFSNKIKDNFVNCQDNDCKVLVAGLTSEFGLTFENNDNFKDGTCFMPEYNAINIQSYDNDVETLYHECGHKLFELHNIDKTDLLPTLKSEMGRKGITKIQNHFRNIVCEKNKLESYDKLVEKANKARELANQKNNELYKEAESKFGKENWSNWDNFNKYIYGNEEWKNLDREAGEAENIVDQVNQAGRKLCRKNSVLADMISGATLNTHNDGYGFGHSQTYWRQDKMLQANEFFAEMIELKATGNMEEYNLIKSFCPKSVERFEQLFKEVYTNRGKVLQL